MASRPCRFAGAAQQEETDEDHFAFRSAAALALAAGAASAATLDDVKARGTLKCGVNTGLAGFASPDADGRWEGFDVAVCRALAAAVLGDPRRSSSRRLPARPASPRSPRARSTCWSRNSTWTFTRDVDLGFTFVGVNYYDGQGFMVSKDLGVTSAKELDGATVCIQTGTTTELNLADFFKANNISLPAGADPDQRRGRPAVPCRRLRRLHHRRLAARDPARHLRGPRRLDHPARDHLQGAARAAGAPGRRPVGRHRPLDAERADRRRGVRRHRRQRRGDDDLGEPEIKRLLGTEGDLGPMFGLDKDWAKRAIMADGNYGELFATHIGEGTPSNIARGLNALWTEGGLKYSPPFR